MSTLLLVILILLLVGGIGAYPAWPYARTWGYAPFGGIGIVVIILLVLLLTGRL